ncbi:hypothetical protein HQ531_07595 [bacterium]|nr:hypothetical protein [bacterium]
MFEQFPEKGFVFWPVGTGDSSTIVINDETIMQIDLHQLEKAEEEDDPHVQIVQELESKLNKVDGKPFLNVFALTHPDEDHIKGFEELLEKVTIGEIWHTPKIFHEYKKDLCDDAIAFKDEVTRRKDLIISNSGNVDVGDRILVVGHDSLFTEGADYEKLPEEFRANPGNLITSLNGNEYSDNLEVFIHAPFKEDISGDRNNTSLALHIKIINGASFGQALFFGDREYPTIKKIFDRTTEKGNTDRLAWNIMLSAHHCSKKVMYWKEEEEGEESLKQDILDEFDKYSQDTPFIVASAEADFTDGKGDNPPHKKARNRYEELIEGDHFICTQEHEIDGVIEPIVFRLDDEGLSFLGDGENNSKEEKYNSGLGSAAVAARGEDEPPTQKTGFGQIC